jgi:hypothetical protein
MGLAVATPPDFDVLLPELRAVVVLTGSGAGSSRGVKQGGVKQGGGKQGGVE